MNRYFIPVILSSVATSLLLLFASSCKSSLDKQALYTYRLSATDTLSYDRIPIDKPTVFEFRNTDPNTPVTFNFYSKQGINYLNAAAMLRGIITNNMSDEQKAIAIWKFVANSGFSYPFNYDHHLQDHVDPMALVTFPYFLCGEKAGIVANLAILAGMPAHRVSLIGHVVAEIKYGGSWHLFDADENCIFRDSSQNIVSVEDLSKHPEWISETNIKLAVENNSFRFKRYRKYLEQYQASWIDTTFIIHNYSFPKSAIMLYPQDEIGFNLIPTSMWNRLLHPRYLFDTRGILKRKMNVTQANINRVNDTLLLFSEEFPYYITELKVASETPVDVNVYFQYQNRETLKTDREYLGNLSKQTTLIKKFNAPSKPDIYYRYKLEFENLLQDDVGGISIQHQFEFNSLTFPLHRRGDKIIAIDSIDQKNVLFQIRKEE